ncbi:MAG: hypothetical protein BRD45_06535 [Bacteroidetes bacterium QS_8_64_10]|jgi:hypothetical protein|nr:MAG: hypothetical protein BRD45_06535 [Bacteroidetes bacterium QS_8_64_10]
MPDSLQETLDTFLNDEAGVPFDQLADFAEPLFDLYQVDMRASLANAQSDGRTDELASLVAVLETARLLWVFLGMRASARRDRFEGLRRVLVGPEAGEAESQSLRELLATLKARRNQLAAEDDVTGPGAFDQLMQRYADRNAQPRDADGSDSTYGEDALPPDEARALFAKPMLESEDVLQDPSQMQEVLDRAETYWDLAHAAPQERRERIASLKTRFAGTEQSEEEVEREAQEMMDRFDRLFPDQQESA